MTPPMNNTLVHSPIGALSEQNAVQAVQSQFGCPFDDPLPLETTPVFSGTTNQNPTAVPTISIQPAMAVGPVAEPSINFVSWAGQRKRRHAICKESGRSGHDCPGETNRSRCKHLVS
jgi:hypothetical protein